jgi:hypothetical protein
MGRGTLLLSTVALWPRMGRGKLLLSTVALFLLSAPSGDAFLQIPAFHPARVGSTFLPAASPALRVVGKTQSLRLAAGKWRGRGGPSRLRMSDEEVDYVVVGGGISGMVSSRPS